MVDGRQPELLHQIPFHVISSTISVNHRTMKSFRTITSDLEESPKASLPDTDNGAFDRKQKWIEIHETPDKRHYSTDTGRVHCTLDWDAASTGLIRLVIDDHAETSIYAEPGTLHSKVRFTIFNSTLAQIGELRQVQSNLTCHAYELVMIPTLKKLTRSDSSTNEERDADVPLEAIPAALVLYQVPSLRDFLCMSPPRRAQMALYRVGELGQGIDSASHCELLEQVQATGRLHGYKTAAVESRVFLESKVPTRKANGRLGLNFSGRGSGSSNKNMQLDRADSFGKPVLQMVKWQEHESHNLLNSKSSGHHKTYHVDFAAPCTLFQAFGFALAQLDL
jgi:hypothetical protein